MRLGAILRRIRLWRSHLLLVLALGTLVAFALATRPDPGAQAEGPQVVPTIGLSVGGSICLQRRYPSGDPSWITNLRVNIFEPGAEEPLETNARIPTYDDGSFFFYVTNTGIYDVGLKSAHALENRLYSVEITRGATLNLDFGTLLEGDVDDSNLIDEQDLDLLSDAFGGTSSQADLDQDGSVTVLDYSWLYTNFGKAGPNAEGSQPPCIDPGDVPGEDPSAIIELGIDSILVEPGQILELPIWVRLQGCGVDGLEVAIRYNPDAVQIVDAAGNPAQALLAGNALGNVLYNHVDSVAGEIHYAAGAALGTQPVCADFVLARLRVKIKALAGRSNLVCHDPLASHHGVEQPLETHCGIVHVGQQSALLALPLVLRNAQSVEARHLAAEEPPTVPYTLSLPLVMDRFLVKAENKTRQRIGVCVVGGIADYDIGQLGDLGWYQNWWPQSYPPRPQGIHFVQAISVLRDEENPERNRWPPDWDSIGEIARLHPGSLWLIGNEPDVFSQDSCTPADYAERYHECYVRLKSQDPSARVSAAGIVQPSPLRLKWLDAVLQNYETGYGEPMPVDAWNIHVQILREVRDSWGCGVPPGLPDDYGEDRQVNDNANVELFKEKIVLFRTWMQENGQRQKPLIISEYGVLMPSGHGYLGGANEQLGDQMVKDFMSGTFDYCIQATDPHLGYTEDGDRLVQAWAWYSLNDKMANWTVEPYELNFNGSLFEWERNYPGTLTQFGLHFREYLAALE
ncbi:MAG: hypothetical protein JXA74_13400 [Anaerolineae bacterium]|nr:hypothetical protein [Anaerolineae bacterium]